MRKVHKKLNRAWPEQLSWNSQSYIPYHRASYSVCKLKVMSRRGLSTVQALARGCWTICIVHNLSFLGIWFSLFLLPFYSLPFGLFYYLSYYIVLISTGEFYFFISVLLLIPLGEGGVSDCVVLSCWRTTETTNRKNQSGDPKLMIQSICLS